MTRINPPGHMHQNHADHFIGEFSNKLKNGSVKFSITNQDVFPIIQTSRTNFQLITINNELPSKEFFHQQQLVYNKKQKRLINIWEDQWHTSMEKVVSRVLALCGVSRSIHGRSTTVTRITKPQAKQFLDQNHLQGYTTSYFKYGLMKGDELMAVACFSKSRLMKDTAEPYRSYELVRFANKAGHTVTGGLGKLLTAFIREQDPDHIMTYADMDWSAGESYLKLGFKLVGYVQPHAFFVDPKTFERIPANRIDERNKKNKVIIFNAGSAKLIMDLRA